MKNIEDYLIKKGYQRIDSDGVLFDDRKMKDNYHLYEKSSNRIYKDRIIIGVIINSFDNTYSFMDLHYSEPNAFSDIKEIKKMKRASIRLFNTLKRNLREFKRTGLNGGCFDGE